MKPCKIAEDKQLHTTSKELTVDAMTRRKNSDEKSGGGSCCEGLDRGYNLSLVEVFRYATFFFYS